jgi:transposase
MDAPQVPRALDGKITEAAEAHPDFFIFQSFPGAGAALAPRLLAALGSQRDRYASAEEIQKYSGIAPVTERSGKKKWVHFRWACPKFLRQSFHEWAAHSIAQSVWARAHYQQQRQRGKDHHAGISAVKVPPLWGIMCGLCTRRSRLLCCCLRWVPAAAIAAA